MSSRGFRGLAVVLALRSNGLLNTTKGAAVLRLGLGCSLAPCLATSAYEEVDVAGRPEVSVCACMLAGLREAVVVPPDCAYTEAFKCWPRILT